MIAPIAGLLVTCMLLVASPADGQVPVPAFEQYVTDLAGVLSADRKQELEAELRVVDGLGIWPAFAAIAAAHMLVFLWQFVLGGEYRRASLDELSDRPLGRLALLQVTIIIGGAGAAALGAPLWAMLVLVGLKLAGELLVHLRLVTSIRSR